MNFAEWLEAQGGPTKVSKKCREAGQKVSRSYLANVGAGRRGLSTKAASRLRSQYPDVSEETWLRWLLPSVELPTSNESSDAAGATTNAA